MKNKNLIPLVLIALITTSCEKVINFEPEDIDPHVVMLSRPEVGDRVDLTLTYSRFFLDNHQFPVIDDATLTLDVNGTVYTPDSAGEGYYRFPYSVQSGDTMTLIARVPGHDEPISAGTRVPQDPQVTILDHVVDTISDYYTFNYRFKTRFAIDAPSPKCYYAIRVLLPYNNLYDSIHVYYIDTTNFYETYFESNDALLSSGINVIDAIDGEDGSFEGSEAIVSSEFFQNGRHEFTVEYFADLYWLYQWDDSTGTYTGSMGDYPVRIEVRSISPELYNYNRSAQETDIFDQLLGEPTQVICNVQGGIGVFGSACRKYYQCINPRHEDFYHSDYYYKKKKNIR